MATTSTPHSDSDLRLLVACEACKAQFDASGLVAGSRLHCACGSLITVPKAHPHDAAVVRCTACGGARHGAGDTCTFCGATFTLRERDLHTICPGCATRISDRGDFCHACGLAIAPQDDLVHATERTCPACQDTTLLGRVLDRDTPQARAPEVSLLECPRCAGIWLGNDVFRVLEERAQREMASTAAVARVQPISPILGAPAKPEATFYRPCARCGKPMNRRNYGDRSGVIIDVCADHGMWFDHEELQAILRWIRRGGAEQAAARAREMARDADRASRTTSVPPPLPMPLSQRPNAGFWPWLVDIGIELLSRRR